MASLNPITGNLGNQRAAHLLRRATFGFQTADIQAFSGLTATAAFQQLIQPQPTPALPIDYLSGTDWVHPNTKHPDRFTTTLSNFTSSWWIESMRTSGANLTERMVWFYHTHFPLIISRVESNPQFSLNYIRLLRFYALGNYKALAKAFCIDNGVLVHLDGKLNIKGVPQENFGREFLELFTVGKGPQIGPEDYTNFTETDVKALTKVLTGWGTDTSYQTIDPNTNLPTGKVKGNGTMSTQHDVSDKQFSAAFNNTLIQTPNVSGSNTTVQGVYDELDDAIDMIFDSPHTATNICRRVYRSFVYYDITPEIETDIITPLAQILRNNNYEITSVLEVLFSSEHFYDQDNTITSDNNIGAIIKSPLDLIIGTLRLFELNVPDQTTDLENHYNLYGQILNQLNLQGLNFFEPYDVAGYDPYFQVPDFQRYWISSNYLANRYKFAELLINGFSANGTTLLKLDFVQFVRDKCTDPADPNVLIQELMDWMIPITLTTDRFNYFKDTVLLDQLSAINWSIEWNNYINTNNDTNVRIQLERLALAIMQSPEYQLY
ncbi:hypothetical protein CW751_08945 [Brumimicrobium salinarum]|uniref:DUF1800 domain-containing protein n=1 Tax=Brumimicrobium salinarum TaxID=2058658 RepID=A0A2I0R1P0_9FLAO|nr:DUF1800 family protein [Brumimicrobium salinarum]PKR80493.1 hypothetical protein CW751_08945 [Brumimicrobium salinarum]